MIGERVRSILGEPPSFEAIEVPEVTTLLLSLGHELISISETHRKDVDLLQRLEEVCKVSKERFEQRESQLMERVEQLTGALNTQTELLKKISHEKGKLKDHSEKLLDFIDFKLGQRLLQRCLSGWQVFTHLARAKALPADALAHRETQRELAQTKHALQTCRERCLVLEAQTSALSDNIEKRAQQAYVEEHSLRVRIAELSTENQALQQAARPQNIGSTSPTAPPVDKLWRRIFHLAAKHQHELLGWKWFSRWRGLARIAPIRAPSIHGRRTARPPHHQPPERLHPTRCVGLRQRIE
ncbi:hypothetical protein PAPYR_1019 [Paratrimastix pyriformis]|uniref:Uncharacterized protein n=1 Tax=Paratrimastix pyriformis TaxID=342808 RepID=A0ABQ8UZZ6_9EUKA|nr:hypothetical protein PAPYR_1019 [Paratrimastix pyriformis]